MNEPNGAVAPRFFFGRTVDGNEWRFGADLASGIADELEVVCRREPPGMDTDPLQIPTTAYVQILNRHAAVRQVWTGPSYCFGTYRLASSAVVHVTDRNLKVLRPYFESWVDEVGQRQPFVALVRGGVAVSVCCSVRITPDAHEAGVETAAEFRCRGYAATVVSQWARVVKSLGPIPLYSTSWQNTASRALARALGLIQYGSVVQIS